MAQECVRVAIRIRPQSAKEQINMCQICTSVNRSENQVFLGKDKAFTYDFVFDTDSNQQAIYQSCSHSLIEGCLEGYNATIFAYGQTGSGKTYTMGTGFDIELPTENVGIIPRAVGHLFDGIEARRKAAIEQNRPPPDFKVNAQFIELYNEEILDLLDTTRDPSEARGKKSHIKIHEDAGGGIYTVGVTTRVVSSLQDTIQCLQIGALSRTTACTNMNAQSSRSHAIFTLHIKQQRAVVELDDGKETDTMQEPIVEFETLTAKFHFVDLAGSERLKRTGATGDRAKEAISINCGLLALGNVISALGDKAKKGSHVPYRDSKLTRLLQDSLGGNSNTVMIACASPSDCDFMETLNALKYANRARNIKNKVTINQDKTSRQINALRSEIQDLKQELMDYKQGKRLVSEDGVESINDMFNENTMLQTENNKLRQRIKALQGTVESLTQRNVTLLTEQALEIVKSAGGDNKKMTDVVQGYVKEIETLRCKLFESESEKTTLERSFSRVSSHAVVSSRVPMTSTNFQYELPPSPDQALSSLLNAAKQNVKEMKQRKATSRQSSVSDKEANCDTKSNNKISNNGELSDSGDDERNINEDDATEQINGELEDDDLEDGDEDELSDSDSSSTEEKDDSDNVHEELADLGIEITIKEQLITELERNQKQIHTLKSQYEQKIIQLQSRIKETETERDKVLANLGSVASTSQEQANKVKKDFEKKLDSMQSEMKKIQSDSKEYQRMARSQANLDRQLKSAQVELGDMKKAKVRLMKEIKAEAARNKQSEAKTEKELRQLRRDKRQKESVIRTMEATQRQKELILKRKQEEVDVLRKRQKPMSAKAAGRVGKYDKPPTKPMTNGMPSSGYGQRRRKKGFSSKVAKQKWDNLEKYVTETVMKKQTVLRMEKDMDIRLKEREMFSKRLEKLEKKRSDELKKKLSSNKQLEDAIINTKAEVEIIQDQISECQDNIMQIEEGSRDENEFTTLVNQCNEDECRYLLEHFMSLVISKGLLAAQKDAENKELQGKLHSSEMNSSIQQQLLQHVIKDEVGDLEIFSNTDYDDNSDDDVFLDRELSAFDKFLPKPSGPYCSTPKPILLRKEKARRKTATPEDLLYVDYKGQPSPLLSVVEEQKTGEEKEVKVVESTVVIPAEEVRMIPKYLPPKVPPKPSTIATVTRPVSAPVAPHLTSMDPSPSLRRKVYSNKSTPEPSPVIGRKALSQLNRQSGDVQHVHDLTPPSSPTASRRTGNVFSRLTSNVQPSSPMPKGGTFVSYDSGMTASGTAGRSFPMTCTKIAQGHTRAVLGLYATDDVLFSGSADRSVKVWDLATGKEVLSLSGHPQNVTCVKYSEGTRLVYSVAGCYIKVWDMRISPAKCICTLLSNGLQQSGGIPTNRQTENREPVVQDLAVNRHGTVMYTAASSTVKIWDLKKFVSVGKFSGGHQAAIMALALDENDDGNVFVVTGSKDHYIKVYEVGSNPVGVITPKHNLEPPHYDGIQSLALSGDILFSGSRDTCIKKWDLEDNTLKQSLNSAHKDWITSLAFLPGGNTLVSSCRGGYLKLWDIDSCQQLAKVHAHSSSINAIATNDALMFTASSDNSIGIWKTHMDMYSTVTNLETDL